MRKQKFIVKKPMHGFKENQVINIEVDDKGIPIERQWRRRLKDAKIDGCLVKEPEIKQKTTGKDK